MVDMFAQDHVCEPGEAQLSYGELSAAFREDLYVTDLTRPLPPIMRNGEAITHLQTHWSRPGQIPSLRASAGWQ